MSGPVLAEFGCCEPGIWGRQIGAPSDPGAYPLDDAAATPAAPAARCAAVNAERRG